MAAHHLHPTHLVLLGPLCRPHGILLRVERHRDGPLQERRALGQTERRQGLHAQPQRVGEDAEPVLLLRLLRPHLPAARHPPRHPLVCSPHPGRWLLHPTTPVIRLLALPHHPLPHPHL